MGPFKDAMSHPFESVDVVGDAATVRLVKERHDTVALALAVAEEVHAGLVMDTSDPVAQLTSPQCQRFVGRPLFKGLVWMYAFGVPLCRKR